MGGRWYQRWSPTETRILEALPGTVADICQRTGLALGTVHKKLADLMEAGEVVRPRRGYYQREVQP